MIVTKNWLQEWIDISDLSVEKISETLNSIGLEVDGIKKLQIPPGVVVGKVLSLEKHPDADKLNVCQVDVKESVLQIVCGAKNVAPGQFVAVATIGADLGNGFVIKKTELRGVESYGMICGADEISLVKMNEGILVLDDSIGELVLGKELCEYDLLRDIVIDIELTANRGDCLSVRGVARDLSAALKRDLFEFEAKYDLTLTGKTLDLDVKENPSCSLLYKIIDIDSCESNLLRAFRLACADKYCDDPFEQNLRYSIHSNGVILRAYDFMKCSNQSDKAKLFLKKDENSIISLYHDDNLIEAVGINQNGDFKYKGAKTALLEASYIDPSFVSEVKTKNKIEADELYFNTSRGSESDLNFGINYFCHLLGVGCSVQIDEKEYSYDSLGKRKIVKTNLKYIENFIGQKIQKDIVESILKRLGLGCEFFENDLKISVPKFRADISHPQDIVEEIVRIIGIDNIASKPLSITPKRFLNDTYKLYKKSTFYRQKAAGGGFFESLHYFFDNKKLMEKYSIKPLREELDLVNPITEELNTLRVTLVLNLIKSVSFNIKNSYKSVKLFELGGVVDQNRNQSQKLAFIFSGQIEEASVLNHGKPKEIDFFSFCDKVSSVIGEFELKKDEQKHPLFSPFEYARVIIDGVDAGYISRLHLNAEKEFDLPKTYVCEIDFKSLKDEIVKAKNYSKFPMLSRDLSLLVPKKISFGKIRENLNDKLPKEIKSFYPIDVYENEELGEFLSLTVRFEIGSNEKTLNEDEINSIVEKILDILKKSLDIGIR